jgi:hypothetical protein
MVGRAITLEREEEAGDMEKFFHNVRLNDGLRLALYQIMYL